VANVDRHFSPRVAAGALQRLYELLGRRVN
jgi:hypothetical protein